MDLVSDCSRCVGLCCAALPFGRSADFAFDKPAGLRCRHLADDASCSIHDRLRSSGMRGCTVYECFGAGQHVVQVTYAGRASAADPEVHAVFGVVRRLHELLVLLGEASDLAGAGPLAAQADGLHRRVRALRDASPEVLVSTDVDVVRGRAGALLREVSAAARTPPGASLAGADLIGVDLRGHALRAADLRGALLLAADLRDVDLSRTDLLGADLRDADLSGADASSAIFLTQPQVNAARGSGATRLPALLSRPPHWSKH